MSGIAGLYYLDGRRLDAALLGRMIDAIRHRGPDGEGHWEERCAGLGHRALHATPESVYEKQPMADEAGSCVIAADARIDNREELIAGLGVTGKPKERITDAELILRAYEAWGEGCPSRLLGDFAFAIWDGRTRRLFCARDPIGIKPFVYHFDGKTFLWASEAKQILEDGTVPREPNLTLIGRYLLNDGSEREETLYRGIYRLPPGHLLVVGEGGIRREPYWDVEPAREIRYPTDAEYAEHFLSLFREAVRSRLRTRGPVGAFLSGGLDSSAIVCMARALQEEGSVPNGALEAYSVVFETLPCDERRYIDQVVGKWRVPANYVVFEEQEAALNLEESRHYRDVFYEPTTFMFIPALRDTRRKGIRALLSGMGGDELLAAGFEHLTDLLLQGRIRTLIEQLHYDAVQYAVPRRTLLWQYCLKPLVPAPLRNLLRPLVGALRGDGIPRWIAPGFLERTGARDQLRRGVPAREFPSRSQQALYEGLCFSWNTTFALGVMDGLASAFSAEFRYPFFDRRLVEFLMAIPEEQRWWKDRPKAILRRALDGILPAVVRDRNGKAEFTPVFDREMGGRQASKVEALLHEPVLERLGVVDGKRLRRFFSEYRHGRRNYYTSGVLSTIVGLELWCRALVDGVAKGG